MRTTASLDPDAAAAVERLRRERGIGVSSAVNALARAGLVASKGDAPTYRIEPAALGLQLDVDNVAETLEILDA